MYQTLTDTEDRTQNVCREDWFNMLMPYFAVLLFISVIGVMMNVFFALCVHRDKEKRFKQPLLLLLYFILCFNGTFQTFIPLSVFVEDIKSKLILTLVYYGILIFTSFSSMSSCVWLSIFYYTKIVPNQRPFFIWMKRNIKLIVYVCLVADRLFLLLDSCTASLKLIQMTEDIRYFANRTIYTETTDMVLSVMTFLHLVYLLACIAAMAASSCATLLYLRRNLLKMGGTDRSSSPQQKNQMRVTNMCIIHTILYIVYALSVVAINVLLELEDGSTLFMIYYMVASLFSTGITVNLGFGTPLFRQKTAEIYNRIKMMFGDLYAKIRVKG